MLRTIRYLRKNKHIAAGIAVSTIYGLLILIGLLAIPSTKTVGLDVSTKTTASSSQATQPQPVQSTITPTTKPTTSNPAPVSTPTPTYTVAVPTYNVASECTAWVSNEDGALISQVDSIHKEYDPQIQYATQELNSVIGTGGANSGWAENYANDVTTLESEANGFLNSDWQSYINSINTYVPLGGAAGACTPDHAEPAYYP